MNNDDKKKWWHRLWGLMISPLFERLGCETTVEVDLSLKAQFLDMVVVKKVDELRYGELNPDYYEGFENLNAYNLISFKSFNESFNITALEELYGHLVNYKKQHSIQEKDRHKFNLYGVTYHFPQLLFSLYKDTGLLKCIKEDKIYDLGPLTPVRFIITQKSEHPILGLFSNNKEQIINSRQRLEEDSWLIREVSSYLGELYKHYSLEGIDMPYTQEMFIRDHYPEWYKKIQDGRNEGEKIGKEIGRNEGEFIGRILLIQEIIHQSIYSRDELINKSTEELQNILTNLSSQLNIVH